jgi:hypothetical protein
MESNLRTAFSATSKSRKTILAPWVPTRQSVPSCPRNPTSCSSFLLKQLPDGRIITCTPALQIAGSTLPSTKQRMPIQPAGHMPCEGCNCRNKRHVRCTHMVPHMGVRAASASKALVICPSCTTSASASWSSNSYSGSESMTNCSRALTMALHEALAGTPSMA